MSDLVSMQEMVHAYGGMKHWAPEWAAGRWMSGRPYDYRSNATWNCTWTR